MPSLAPSLVPTSTTLAPSTPTGTATVVGMTAYTTAQTLPPALPNQTMTVKYTATPSGYQPTAEGSSPDPSGSFASFPPGCGSGGTCDWEEYRAQQERAARSPTIPFKAPQSAGGSPYAAPGATAMGPDATPTPSADTGGPASSKLLVPIAQVQCALMQLMGTPTSWPALAQTGEWDSVTQRYLDGFIAQHMPQSGYTVVDGAIELDDALAQTFSQTSCGVPTKRSGLTTRGWWVLGLTVLVIGGGVAWWATRR